VHNSEMQIEDLNNITGKIIACAIEVHKNIGPGLLESVYEKALCLEFELNGLKYEKQISILIVIFKIFRLRIPEICCKMRFYHYFDRKR